MIDAEKRKEFEQTAIETVKGVYNNIAGDRTITYTIPDDVYAHWDMTVTVNGIDYKAENKIRNVSYKAYKDEGYYLDVSKADGTIDLFNYYFPVDNVLMTTDYNHIKDLKPQDTYIKKDVYCDPDSQPRVKKNIVVPYDRWWVYNTTNNQLISKPI